MKKKLLSVILAVAVAFTFSFAMVGTASADTLTVLDTEWSADYSKVTVTTAEGSTTLTPVYAAINEKGGYATYTPVEELPGTGTTDWCGVIKAYLTPNQLAQLNVTDVPAAYFYNIAGADVVTGSTVISSSYKTAEAATTAFSSVSGLTLYCPSNVWNASNVRDEYGVLPSETITAKTLGAYTWSLDVSGFDPTSSKEQSFDASLNFKLTDIDNTKVNSDIANADYIGSYTKAIKVTAAASTPGIYVDTVSDDTAVGTAVSATYDGAEHKIVYNAGDYATELPSATYKIYNYKTGKWDAATEVTYKDATGDEPIIFQWAPVTAKGVVGTYSKVTINVGKAHIKAYFKNRVAAGISDILIKGSKLDLNEGDYQKIIDRIAIIESKDYDAEDLNALVDFEVNVASKADDYDSHVAALAANKEEIVAAFNEGYDVEEAAATNLPTITLTNYSVVGIKALNVDSAFSTQAEVRAFYKKYEALYNNFDIDVFGDTTDLGADAYAVLIEKNNTAEDDVTFTKYVHTIKGYSKKTKTCTFTAEAESGNTVIYKLTGQVPSKVKIDSSTGKITVKKGLKKGKKYTFNVKAYTKAGNGYKAASETNKVTVKVVK